MRSFFGGGDRSGNSGSGAGEKLTRHSSGWRELLKHLQTNESLRVLDIGPTSSMNINFVTGLGHSIYMANLVEEAAKPEWLTVPAPGEPAVFDVEGFLTANLSFSGRMFDVVTFWDTLDYLPAALVAPLLERIHQFMKPGGLLLAFFHSKMTGTSPIETAFHRYHLTGTDVLELRNGGNYPLQSVYNNRQVENLLKAFSSFRFFLAKDNLREVLSVR